MAGKYIAEQAAMWVIDFFRHWYAGGLRGFLKTFIKLISVIDRVLALRVSVKNIFTPMYQDRSAMGYVMGFLFRTIRIVTALVLYAVIGTVFAAAYIVWSLIPPYLAVKAINPNVQSLL